MTVKRLGRDSDVFNVTCDTKTCKNTTRVRATDAFQLARVAGRLGWTVGTKIRCASCPEPVVKPKVRKR